MRPLSDKKYQAKVVGLGRKLVGQGILPDLSQDEYFLQGYAKNLANARMHIETWAKSQEYFHPEHHIFLAHTMVNTGHIVWGDDFSKITVKQVNIPRSKKPVDINFAEEQESLELALEVYKTQQDGRYILQQYANLRDKESIYEQVSIIEKHLASKISTKGESARNLNDILVDMAINAADPGAKTKKQYSKDIIRHAYLLGALMKGIRASEKLSRRGLETYAGASNAKKKKRRRR